VLTAVDFDDEALLETGEIENEVSKGDLATKFEKRKTSVAKQAPHGRLGIRGFMAHFLGETPDALGGRSMVWRLRRKPLTRRLTS